MDSGTQILTATFRHDILTTVMFPDFNQEDIRSNKLDNLNMNISRFIYTEQNMKVMVLKILHSVSYMLLSIL